MHPQDEEIRGLTDVGELGGDGAVHPDCDHSRAGGAFLECVRRLPRAAVLLRSVTAPQGRDLDDRHLGVAPPASVDDTVERGPCRSDEHTSDLTSLIRNSY